MGFAQQECKWNILDRAKQKRTIELHKCGAENDPFYMGRKGSGQTYCNGA